MKKLRLMKLFLDAALLALIGTSTQSCRKMCYISMPGGNNNVRHLSNDHYSVQDSGNVQDTTIDDIDSTRSE